MSQGSTHICINGRRIGPGEPMYLVAEMSANHHQDFEEALRILEEAKSAGADAVKLQTYTPDTLTIDCDNEAPATCSSRRGRSRTATAACAACSSATPQLPGYHSQSHHTGCAISC